MSFLLSNNNFNPLQLNHKELGQEFCKYYYNAFSSYGINGVVNLYHPYAQITFLEEECVGVVAYNQKLINLGLSKLMFNNLIGTTQPHGTDNIIISVAGDCCAHNGIWGKFTDVFIISLLNGNWIITHHIFKAIS
jgi:hypothetical protein